jgi:hypothetical protein
VLLVPVRPWRAAASREDQDGGMGGGGREVTQMNYLNMVCIASCNMLSLTYDTISTTIYILAG